MVKLAEEKNFRQRIFIIPDISTYVPTSTPSPCFQFNSALFRCRVVYVFLCCFSITLCFFSPGPSSPPLSTDTFCVVPPHSTFLLLLTRCNRGLINEAVRAHSFDCTRGMTSCHTISAACRRWAGGRGQDASRLIHHRADTHRRTTI